MEQWSILSNVVNYVQYDMNPKEFYNLDAKAIDQKKIYDRLNFGNNPDKLRGGYLDMYEGVKS